MTGSQAAAIAVPAEGGAPARHPTGLYPLFFTEMWERFSFYLMLGLLYQYLTDSQKGGMGWNGVQASSVYGSYLALVYFSPFLGGIIADRVLGFRKTILIGGATMMVGHIVLAIPTDWALYLGLVCLVIGNGAFKPNISTMVGNLYPPGSPLKDAGFNIFYMGINIGAFTCNFAASIVRNIWGWHAAFATAGIGMGLGLLVFIKYRGLYAHIDPDPRARAAEREPLTDLWFRCLIPALGLGALGFCLVEVAGLDLLGLGGPTTGFLLACFPVVAFYLRIWRGVADPGERGRVAGLLAIFSVVIIFWAIFHQNGTALTDWAVDDTNREPSAAVRVITDAVPDFAENAPPSYFANAGPRTPRPHRDTFEVVSDARYERLKKAKALSVEDGKRVPITRTILDEAEEHTNARTPVLPRGRHLKLVNAEIFQSINPGFVILLTPLLIALWRFLASRQREPTTPAKIGLGLLITAGGPLIMLLAVIATNDGAIKASSYWLIGTYGLLTLGELCLSPMGLSLVSKMAPARIRGFMMGGWFVATAIGNKLSGVFGEIYQTWPHVRFYILMIACVLVAAATVGVLMPWLKRQMPADAAY